MKIKTLFFIILFISFAITNCFAKGYLFGTPQISIANFNIQVFGKTKANKQEVLESLAKIISQYDIVSIQEIRDKSGTAIEKLEKAADDLQIDYEYIIGPRLGRTSSKEQYAFMYRTNSVEVVESYTYDDSQEDIFHREPFIAKFKAKGGSFDFVLITIHTDPDDATEEINSLPKVVNAAMQVFPDEKDFIILGDLNADCSYFNEEDQVSPLRSSEYIWLITNDMDTNLAESSCTYDRIIITNNTLEDYSGKCGVFRFDQPLGLSAQEAKKVSDHYPVYSIFNINSDTD